MKKPYQSLEKIAAVVIILAILASCFICVDRVQAEHNNKNVQLMVNETDVRAFANANKLSLKEMLIELKNHGVSQVLFKEVSLADLEHEGKIGLYQGMNVYDSRDQNVLPADMTINDASRYVVVYDKNWKTQVWREVQHKVRNSAVYTNPDGYDVIVIPSMIAQTPQEDLAAREVVETVGVGYDLALMKQVAAAGMGVVPQIRNWRTVDATSLKLLQSDLKAIPNLSMIMMNDKVLPGYPERLKELAVILKDEQGKPLAPLGIVEFSKQAGIEKLGLLMNKDVVRIHTITNAEMSKYEGDLPQMINLGKEQALDRFTLAASERNMRSLLVRFFQIDEPAYSLKFNMTYLDDIKANLEKDGFKVGGAYAPLEPVLSSVALHLLIGMGVLAGLYLLLLQLRLKRSAIILTTLMALGWVGAYFYEPELARKLMSLLSVVVFPTLSCIRFLPTRGDDLKGAVLRLLCMSAASFVGAILMLGLLSGNLFMLKLDQFVGVKLAHILPILAVPFILYIWQTPQPLARLRKILDQSMQYRWAIFFGILSVALAIYVIRTGNTSGEISQGEMGMRQWLTDIFGVRPRSKEFLIGYPLTLIYFVFAKNRNAYWILTVPAVIGQVSLVNTYAHIHTPLLISLWRSANGMVLGIVIGVIACVLLDHLTRAINRYAAREQKRGERRG